MKNSIQKHIILLFLISFAWAIGQEPLHNFGNLKIHADGAIGFHHNLINNGFTDDNLGLAGFYGNEEISISGAFRPIFNDIEVVVANNLVLEVGVGITNNANFVLGDVRTPRALPDINLDFISGAFYSGQTDFTKIDGYAGLTNSENFIFPTGDDDKLRPLELNSTELNTMAKCAYYFEDPNAPTAFLFPFDTDSKTDILTAVSTYEFWDLDTDVPSSVKLTWDLDSNLANFVDELENLRVIGWHKTNNIWESLGGNSIIGDFDSGEITSDVFIPDDYAVLSFGSSLSTNNINLDNLLLTPNGDGTNDVLHFEAISLSPTNNSLRVYNRWGRLVYSAEDYKNNFGGISDNSFTVSPNTKLPDGVYFYILKLDDINITHQGYLAIQN